MIDKRILELVFRCMIGFGVCRTAIPFAMHNYDKFAQDIIVLVVAWIMTRAVLRLNDSF